ncbi:hypothetical protein CORC01_06564 [Colletotrichum orchidophilum]|uniref:BTB domain-containing protein n=1 Tax=Colletotrichum orchidophilum TaxID=1209926 RepID=A0A1G4BA59_9PEZI|nr:uncharacterized protein CORC01_06564 [Colletotrichum orchidophilum]OHE98196.1 hypothetical protein CORC01_06564 [Colletotrichum orchidophilum]
MSSYIPLDAKGFVTRKALMEVKASDSSSSSTQSPGSINEDATAEKAETEDPDSEEEAVSRQTNSAVAPKGDLTLVVGPSGNKIRVYALILSNASPIFASMISKASNAEDTTLSHQARISLPDDDPMAMEIICHVIHGNSLDADVIDIPPGVVLAVAALSAKYDCAPALTRKIEHWLSPETMETIAQSGLVHPEKKDLLLAAYWFRHERAFEMASLRFITEIAWSFCFLADGTSGEEELVALRIALALEEKRNELRLYLYTHMMEQIHAINYCECSIPKSHWWKRPFHGKQDTKPATTAVISSVLRNIDRDILSRGTPYMSINEMMRLADDGTPNTLVWNRVGRRNADLARHKTLMRCSVRHLKRSGMMRGICLRCFHPRMECEDHLAHGKEKEREFREWLPGEVGWRLNTSRTIFG